MAGKWLSPGLRDTGQCVFLHCLRLLLCPDEGSKNSKPGCGVGGSKWVFWGKNQILCRTILGFQFFS